MPGFKSELVDLLVNTARLAAQAAADYLRNAYMMLCMGPPYLETAHGERLMLNYTLGRRVLLAIRGRWY